MSMNKNYSNTIYLAGSFSGFRDKIIKALPGVKFTDPRDNRQFAMYATNCDDIESATYCPAVVGCFPKEKPKGVMTFVELGIAYASRSEIIIANENGEENKESELLKETSKDYFTSIDDMVNYLGSYKIPKKKVKEPKENLGEIKNVYFCGTITDNLKELVIEPAKEKDSKKNYILMSDDIIEDYNNLDDFQQIVVDFPGKMKIDRRSCFIMGAAVFKKIPILLRDAGEFPYSPLSGGLQRRLVRTYEGMLDYVVSVNNANISKEALFMYGGFKKFDGRE